MFLWRVTFCLLVYYCRSSWHPLYYCRSSWHPLFHQMSPANSYILHRSQLHRHITKNGYLVLHPYGVHRRPSRVDSKAPSVGVSSQSKGSVSDMDVANVSCGHPEHGQSGSSWSWDAVISRKFIMNRDRRIETSLWISFMSLYRIHIYNSTHISVMTGTPSKDWKWERSEASSHAITSNQILLDYE